MKQAEKTNKKGAPRHLDIKIARQVGYCYGVKRALDIAVSAEGLGRVPIFTLGPIIHNPQVVESLKARGIDVVGDMSEVSEGTILIRSHGVAPGVVTAAKKQGIHVMDATCPFVKKAQQKAAELAKDGYYVVILGEKNHPEVLGLVGYAGGNAIVIEHIEDIMLIPKKVRKIGLVTQTTQSEEKLRDVTGQLAARVAELKVYNTICNATKRRQADALSLTKSTDVMLVVGGKNSANTSRLAEMCREAGAATYHIETADDIDAVWFRNGDIVGVTTGASTSPDILQEVIEALQAMTV